MKSRPVSEATASKGIGHTWDTATEVAECDLCGEHCAGGVTCGSCQAIVHATCASFVPWKCTTVAMAKPRWWADLMAYYPIIHEETMFQVGSLGLHCGTAHAQGRRQSMEDADLAYGDGAVAFFGIFDGHGGDASSIFVAEHIHEQVMLNPYWEAGAIEDALVQAFETTDEMIHEALGPSKDGSTATLVTFTDEENMFLANVGDSESLLGSTSGEHYLLTVMHNTKNAEEAQRIQDAGAYLLQGKVDGYLATTRALGDFDYKEMKGGVVIPTPHTVQVSLDRQRFQYLVVACDGLWDVLTYPEVVERINLYQTVLPGQPGRIAELLIRDALILSSQDNISVQVILFTDL